MSITTQVTTFLDCYTSLLNAVRFNTSLAASSSQAQRAINVSLHDIHLGNDYKFPWCERQATLLTHARYSTGTVTISQGSTSLAGTGTAWTTGTGFGFNNMRVGGKVTIQGDLTPYEISAVGSATGATLATRFVGESVSAGSYLYFEDEYALASDFFRPVDLTFFDTDRSIRLINRDEFYQHYTRNTNTNKPKHAMLIDKAPSGTTARVRRLVLAPPPDQTYVISYRYITTNLVVGSDGTQKENFTADTDEPLLPLRYRHAIVLHALASWYRDKKDDTRSQEAWGQYVDIVTRMTADVEPGNRLPRLQPVMGSYRAAAQEPWTGRGRRTGYYDGAGRFDWDV